MDICDQMLAFFQDFGCLTEVLGRDIRANDPGMSTGYQSPKLPLWADFSFLKKSCRSYFWSGGNSSGTDGIRNEIACESVAIRQTKHGNWKRGDIDRCE